MSPYDDTPLQLARLRQAELQAIADQQPVIRISELRQRLGGAIVRFGHWVANQCPDIATEAPGDMRARLSRP